MFQYLKINIKKKNNIIYKFICIFLLITDRSMPGNLKTPQKQNENRGFDPGQAPAEPSANSAAACPSS